MNVGNGIDDDIGSDIGSGMSGRERSLAEAFAELSAAMAYGSGPDALPRAGTGDVLRLLTERCSAVVGAACVAALLADEGGRAWTAAGSDERAVRLARLELREGEGPCSDAHREASPVSPGTADEAAARWPRFDAEAGAAGLSVAWAVPMRCAGSAVGALAVFRPPDVEAAAENSSAAVAVTQALADAVATGIVQQRVLRRSEQRAEQLQSALTSRIVVEQAKGVLAERWGVSIDTAFAALRRHARTHRLRLSDLARGIVDNAVDSEALRADGGEAP
ncbi:ANTAR domain-containing protein [Streptomyces sp. RB6PN25]|uniref:ANTAR domain-containing protein n=1 Tax=Streptomyces humicola TaxID=2953240 RepID=A0ABT1Q1L5_9ACTN|nr:ANTAR domain-containing protein [Streptomyces humicola]MCQ4083796.1 ANTAR domain-containing protein [Streptomyces humicola]